MEGQIGVMSLEEQTKDSSLTANTAERIRRLLTTTPQELDIVRLGEFCRSSNFCKDLNSDTVELIYKTLIHEVKDMETANFRSEFFSRAGEEALLRSIRFRDADALKRAIAYGSLAVYHVTRRMPERGIVISAFGRTLRQRWNISEKDEHLDETIYYFQKTTQFEPSDEANRALHLDDLGCVLMNRYKRTHRQECFIEARESFETAVGLHHPGTPMFYSNLGQLLLEKTIYEQPKDIQAFDESITMFKSALQSVTDQFKGSVSAIYYHLGHTYIARFLIAQLAEDWQNAVEAFDESLSRVKPPNSNYLNVCYRVARFYSDVFGKFGNLEVSDKAEICYRLALQSSPDDPTVMASLGEELRFRAYCTGMQAYLNEAIQWTEKAVQKTSIADPEFPFRLGRQANALADRFGINENVNDIDQAIAALWKILEAPGLKTSDCWMYWELLGSCLLLRHEKIEESDDLEIAEWVADYALDLVGVEDKSAVKCLRLLGKMFFRKYKLDRNSEHLEKSIQMFRKSIDLAGVGDHAVYSTYNDLGNSLVQKFEKSGSNEDLQSAANSYLEALERLRKSRTNSARNDEAMILHGLGNVQFRQFKVWNRVSDLDTAISYYKKSADATSESNVKIVTRVGTLSWALQERFDITHKLDDLKDAERRLEAIIALPLRLSSESTSYVQNRMGLVYLRYYFHTTDDKYLNSAAECFQKAFASKCKDIAYNISAQNNLAITLQHKFKATKSDVDLMAALTQFTGLLRFAESSHYETGHIIMNVAEFLSSIYDLKKDPAMGKGALAAYVVVLRIGQVSPKRKVDARMRTARLSLTLNNNGAMTFGLLTSALEDLPEAILMGLNRSDKLRIIRDCAWIPGNIVAAAVMAGKSAEEALRLFESSRCIIWDNLLNERYNTGPLESQHPVMAAKFEQAQQNIRQTMSADKMIDPTLMRKRQESHQSSLEYNELLDQIRKLDGFNDFLRLPQGPSSLTEFATDGPIVIVNSNEFRSDSIVIKRGGVMTIPLPRMTMEANAQNAAKLLIALSDMTHSPEQASKSFKEVLIWLWDTVARPILKELGLLSPIHCTEKPRVWWMVTGWISIFPIHAAGDHDRASSTGEPCSVIDLITPSYCNSLRSLQDARNTFAARKHSPATQDALLLRMPQTPNQAPLPGVQKETSLIKAMLEKSLVHANIVDTPNRDIALSSLKTHQIAHFACHGVVDAEDPSLSRLLLKDWKQRPLNVRILLQTKDVRCNLVFLSACESAIGKDMKLREEGMHIAGGFQMAGVPHVIGTLWRVEDEFGAQVAEEFYRGLANDNGLDISKSAESLRDVLLNARAKGVDPLYWASYIHCGP